MAVPFPDIAEPVSEPFFSVQRAQCPVIVELPRVGECKGSPVSLEEFHAQLFFQVLYAEGQGGLGNEEPGGGPGDGPFLGGGDDILQLVPVHGDSFRKYYIQWQTGEETGKTENIVLNYENMTKLYIIQMQDTMIRYRKI
jgi:hypothetical protein